MSMVMKCGETRRDEFGVLWNVLRVSKDVVTLQRSCSDGTVERWPLPRPMVELMPIVDPERDLTESDLYGVGR